MGNQPLDTSRNRISIIIRTKNEEKSIGAVLDAVFDQEIDLDYEVIVIDSGSTDKTIQILEKYPVRLYKIAPDDFSWSYSLNLGVQKTNGEFIVILSAHALPMNKNWLYYLCQPLLQDSSETIAACWGREVPHEHAILPEKIRLKYFKPMQTRTNINFYLNDKDIEDHLYETARISNVNCCIRRSLIQRYPFKEELSGEDRTWAMTVVKEGYTIVYEPRACVYHSHNDTVVQMAKRRARTLIAESYRKGSNPKKYLGPYLFVLIRMDIIRSLRFKEEPLLSRIKWAFKLTLHWLVFWTYVLRHLIGHSVNWF